MENNFELLKVLQWCYRGRPLTLAIRYCTETRFSYVLLRLKVYLANTTASTFKIILHFSPSY